MTSTTSHGRCPRCQAWRALDHPCPDCFDAPYMRTRAEARADAVMDWVLVTMIVVGLLFIVVRLGMWVVTG